MSKNTFIVIVLLAGAAAIAGEWYWKNRDFVLCRAEAKLELGSGLKESDAAASIKLIEDHFARDSDFSISFSKQARTGEISGLFRRKITKPTELGKKLSGAGESAKNTAAGDHAAVEKHIRSDLESIPWTLNAGSFGVHLVIDDPEKIALAAEALRESVPTLIAEEQIKGVPAVYGGENPLRDAPTVAAVPAGTGQKILLANYWDNGKSILVFLLVEDASPVGLAELVSIEELEKSNPMMFTGGPEFMIRLDQTGADSFSTFTAANVGRQAAFVINEFAHSVPQIQSAINEGSIILSLGRGSDRRPGQRLATSLMLGKEKVSDLGLVVKDVAAKCY